MKGLDTGDIVYVYRPVVTPEVHRKLLRPSLGLFHISQKTPLIHVKFEAN